MRFEIVTIFPGFFASIFENGILRRALAEGLVEVGIHDLRAFTHDRHRTVDDRPFGGGEGMVLKPEPIAAALASIGVEPKFTEASQENSARPTVILLSAQGRPFTQSLAREIASLDRVVLLCGRYEGVDERINQLYCDMEFSIGDYVLSGGELAAAVVIDAAMRLLPGVLGNEASSEFESFGFPDADIAGLKVPEPLLNGDHQAIRRWRREQQLRKTLANRPDLLEHAKQAGALSRKDLEFLEQIQQVHPQA